jgi:hypothetical protein
MVHPGNKLPKSLVEEWDVINQSDHPCVRDHVIQSNTVYTAAVFIAMAIEAARKTSRSGNLHIPGYGLRDIHLHQAMVVPAHPRAIEVQVELRPRTSSPKPSSGWKNFTIHATEHDKSWTAVCKGRICVHYTETHSQQSNRSEGTVAAGLPPPLAPERYRV